MKLKKCFANHREIKTMIENILSDWKVLCDSKGITRIIKTRYGDGKIYLNQNTSRVGRDYETIYDIMDKKMDGHVNDVSEDLRDYLRRRGIKIYADRFFKSI